MVTRAIEDEKGRIHLLYELGLVQGAEPPTEFQILSYGVNPTSKGDVLFDEEAAESVMKRYAEHGISQLPIDYDHGMLGLIATSETSKAAGWFTPIVNEKGALVASGVQWTPKAAKALSEREFRFFSPALYKDEKTGRVTRLINLALTNLPATKGQLPLVAKDDIDTPCERHNNRGNMSEILKLLGVKTEAEALVAIDRKDSAVKLLLSEIGTETLDSAISAVQKLKVASAKSIELAETVRKLEQEKSDNAREQLIAKLSDEGKLPLSLHDWARTQSLESLSTFGESAPVDPKRTNHEPAGEAAVTLSESELLVCKQLGMSRAQFIEAKKQKALDDEKLRAEREGRVL